MAKAAVDVLLTITREFVSARMMCSHGIPFAMAGLLEEDAGLRGRSLTWLQRPAVKLKTRDDAALNGDAIAVACRKAMVWPQMSWPRELLLHLEEVGFEGVPKVLGGFQSGG